MSSKTGPFKPVGRRGPVWFAYLALTRLYGATADAKPSRPFSTPDQHNKNVMAAWSCQPLLAAECSPNRAPSAGTHTHDDLGGSRRPGRDVPQFMTSGDHADTKKRAYTLCLAGGLSVILAAPALALSITNKDDAEHNLFIDLGAEETMVKIGAGKTLDLSSQCGDRCGVTAPCGFTREASSGDKLTLSDGDVWPTNQGG